MTIRERGVDVLNKLCDAVAPLLQDHTVSITLTLSGSEARVMHAALAEFTTGGDGWEPIATLPTGREWDIWDNEMSEDVSLARAVDNGAPLFFLLQEKDARGIYEHTKWQPAVRRPNPPDTAAAKAARGRLLQ